MSRDLNKLTPSLRIKLALFKEKAHALGIDFIVTCVDRAYGEQLAIHAQGRESLVEVNDCRRDVGLGPITEHENHIVTWTFDSKHVIGSKRKLAEAFDIVIVKNGKPTWDIKVSVNHNEIPDYLELARLGLTLGLKPGATFSKPDYPHYEEA